MPKIFCNYLTKGRIIKPHETHILKLMFKVFPVIFKGFFSELVFPRVNFSFSFNQMVVLLFVHFDAVFFTLTYFPVHGPCNMVFKNCFRNTGVSKI